MSYPSAILEHMNDNTVSLQVKGLLDTLDSHLEQDWTHLAAAALHAEVVALEKAARKLRAARARVLTELSEAGRSRELGFVNTRQLLTCGLGLSPGEARGHLQDAAASDSPRMAASAAGALSSGHLRIITETLARLPEEFGEQERLVVEKRLITLAEGTTTRRMFAMARDVLEEVAPGHTRRTERERARSRSMVVGAQDSDLMSTASLRMDPELTALVRELHARWAQPGRLWTDTETEDERTDAQRMHDAMAHALRLALSSDARAAGSPAAIVIRMNLDQLSTLAGTAETDAGIRLPVEQALSMAQGSHWFLALCDKEIDLRLFRARRTASAYQRLALFAAYGGCTHPDCDQDARHCEAHHADRPWSRGGLTNIGELSLASGDCHAQIHETGWSMIPDPAAPQGVRWIPPAGSPRRAERPPVKPGAPPMTPLTTTPLPFALLADMDRALTRRAAERARDLEKMAAAVRETVAA